LTRKKRRPFLDIEERVAILMALKHVNTVIRFDDDDDTSIKAIEAVRKMNPNDAIIFANGGDKNESNTPEFNILRNVDSGVHFVFGIGGNKQNSSSDLLSNWVNSEDC
jgi:bifunctional ADP-heptose synthase (sugar kinase/adenylyltransferase)